MLTLEDVNVYYDQVHALKSVTIEVKEGELVALLGANGAGKSTILMTISGILRPRSGHVRYEGHDLTRSSPYDIIQVGIGHCPEGRHIFGNLTVQENMLMGAVQRKDRAGVQRDMEWVYSLFPVLGERVRQSGATLSGGEQQMLAIGRALMGRPRLLLMDEPSLGLAPVIVQLIFKVIKQLHQQGVTILLVEQNARQALQVADRCYLLETGRVVMSGPVEALRTNPEIERIYLGGSAV
ncbi:MAG TPA: ABC transporter ATP-binding protein [Anaerolineales bacterium]|nr:ABC transporter ATP-binding protein [Anaerolineales bacterium]